MRGVGNPVGWTMLGGRQIDLGSEGRCGAENRLVGADSMDLIDDYPIQEKWSGYKPEFWWWFLPGLRILITKAALFGVMAIGGQFWDSFSAYSIDNYAEYHKI